LYIVTSPVGVAVKLQKKPSAPPYSTDGLCIASPGDAGVLLLEVEQKRNMF
jgi:hypothetical protein